MLTLVPKRPLSPSSQTSPLKRTKTPSPQKPILRGYYSPVKSTLRSKLEAVALSPQTRATSVQIRSKSGEDNLISPSVGGRDDDEGRSRSHIYGSSFRGRVSSLETSAILGAHARERTDWFGRDQTSMSHLTETPAQQMTAEYTETDTAIPPPSRRDISTMPVLMPFASQLPSPCTTDPSYEQQHPIQADIPIAAATLPLSSADRAAEDRTDTTDALNVELPFTGILKYHRLLISGKIRTADVSLDVSSEELRSLDLGFTLVSNTGVQRSPTRAEVRLMREIYPEIREVIHLPPFLIIVCMKLPKTTPMSITGLPCHFTLDRTDIPLLGRFCRGEPTQIGTYSPPFKLPDSETRKLILKTLSQYRVRSIGWLTTRWLLEVDNPDETTQASLPSVLNGLITSYRPYRRPVEHSLTRIKLPSRLVIDNTNYAPLLHAGMLLDDGDQFTTSGCPVSHSDKVGERFFTIAAHGFVLGASVMHPVASPPGKVIAEADQLFGDTDIGLARITDDSISYTSDCFAGSMGTIRLRNLIPESENLVTREIFMDSPFTGLGTGLVVGHGITAIPSDEPVDEWKYVSSIWIKFASGAKDPVGGRCGSPLFDKDGNVYGFYRYFADDGTGISYCPTPDPLIDAGYGLESFEPGENTG